MLKFIALNYSRKVDINVTHLNYLIFLDASFLYQLIFNMKIVFFSLSYEFIFTLRCL